MPVPLYDLGGHLSIYKKITGIAKTVILYVGIVKLTVDERR
jgi:hypothetical protein